MKSAYELAMERLAKAEPEKKLTPEQKARLAEINSRYQAKLAERETFLKGLLVKAEAARDFKEIAEVRQQLGRDLASIRDEWEEKKNLVWKE
jgi:hypothetical protein